MEEERMQMLEDEGEDINIFRQRLNKAQAFIKGQVKELCEKVRERLVKGDHDIQFLLSRGGIQIITADRVLMQQGTIWSTGYKNVYLSQEQNVIGETDWSLVQWRQEEPNIFWIENVYGEFKPKLMPYYKNPSTWSSLLSSNRKKDGYTDADKCLWFIEDMSDPNLKQLFAGNDDGDGGIGQK